MLTGSLVIIGICVIHMLKSTFLYELSTKYLRVAVPPEHARAKKANLPMEDSVAASSPHSKNA